MIKKNQYTREQLRSLGEVKGYLDRYRQLLRFYKALNDCTYMGRVLDLEGNVVDEGYVPGSNNMHKKKERRF